MKIIIQGRQFIYRLITVGLRVSEIQALKWTSVDFDRNQITIKEAYKSNINKTEPYPKQRDWLVIPMPYKLSSYLKRQKDKNISPYVAPAQKSGMLFSDKLRYHLTKFCRDLNLRRITIHQMRHSCTEIWISQGASVEDIRRLLGHKINKDDSQYIHRTDDRLENLAQKIL